MPLVESMLTQRQNLWEQLEPYGTTASFRRRSLIYSPDQPAQALYLLHKGQVSLQLISAGGRALTLEVIEAGQLFGHSALAGARTYDTFAEAVKPTHTIAVGQSDVLRLMRSAPGLALALLEEIGRYRAIISRRLDEVAFKSVPARLASLLLEMAQSMPGAEPAFRLPHRTHQQLAEMINAYRETVTKVINQFRAARLLDIDRSGITLLNPSRLRELAQDQLAR